MMTDMHVQYFPAPAEYGKSFLPCKPGAFRPQNVPMFQRFRFSGGGCASRLTGATVLRFTRVMVHLRRYIPVWYIRPPEKRQDWVFPSIVHPAVDLSTQGRRYMHVEDRYTPEVATTSSCFGVGVAPSVGRFGTKSIWPNCTAAM